MKLHRLPLFLTGLASSNPSFTWYDGWLAIVLDALFFLVPSSDEEGLKMSILHTLAPVRLVFYSASSYAAGQHAGVLAARDLPGGGLRRSPWHRQSLEHQHGLGPLYYPKPRVVRSAGDDL
ncbi:hypothetical protein EVAR_99268_1 [Eumeta japonica]|uniref:Uncharacterized protein n=1 Tax=Eumeta variegata TaxID=151549 RepID=A0A4C1ZBQ0_EUMVA|nr:hypothetical protein EVAR_99268_1 [Eumeta japonica]